MAEAGIEVRIENNKVFVESMVFGSAAEKAGLDFDWEILGVKTQAERPPKQLMFVPALVLLGVVAFFQRGRRGKAAPVAA